MCMNAKDQDPRPDVTAATRGGDVSLGMQGEDDPTTASRDQAIFWQSIYREILTMEEAVISHMQMLMQELSLPAREEVARTNLPVVLAQAEKFRMRLAYWTAAINSGKDEGE